MDELGTTRKELLSLVENPRIYIANHFDEIRSQIDIGCQTYLNRHDLQARDKERAVQHQQGLINEVNLLQKKCLTNLEKNLLDQSLGLNALSQSLKCLSEKDLYCRLYNTKKLLFLNKAVIFLSSDNYREFFKISNPTKMFGVLFIVEDEFFDKIQRVKEDKINNDLCNEFLRIILLKLSLRNEETDNENTENTVKFVKLNLNQIELFSLKDFPFIENGKAFLKDWLIELPALHFIDLIDCNLEELEPTIFQNLIFLEKLYLSYNSIRELDANIFSCNKNLKILNLGKNRLTTLKKETFKGLHKLTELNLYQNELNEVPDELFQDPVSLEHLDLEYNKIKFAHNSCTNVFKGLSNLKRLYLTSNEIGYIPEGLFQNLISLESLDLTGNKINFEAKNPNVFRGLGKLTELRFSCDQINIIPDGFFQSLDCLEYLWLEGNIHIQILDKSYPSKLKEINLVGYDCLNQPWAMKVK